MPNRWYISDTHFHHANIIQYGNRPFRDVEQMHEALIEAWNSVVRPQDHVTHLGDVSILRGNKQNQEKFIKLIKQLNGHKRLALGNHDHFPIRTYLEVFEKIYATWRSDEGIIFSHIPIHPRSMGRAIANVHGHIHQNPDYEPVVNTFTGKIQPYINVCVEALDYIPIHIEDLKVSIKNAIKEHEDKLNNDPSYITSMYRSTSPEAGGVESGNG